MRKYGKSSSSILMIATSVCGSVPTSLARYSRPSCNVTSSLIGLTDHMVVGQDVAVLGDDEPRSLSNGRLTFTRRLELGHCIAEESLRAFRPEFVPAYHQNLEHQDVGTTCFVALMNTTAGETFFVTAVKALPVSVTLASARSCVSATTAPWKITLAATTMLKQIATATVRLRPDNGLLNTRMSFVIVSTPLPQLNSESENRLSWCSWCVNQTCELATQDAGHSKCNWCAKPCRASCLSDVLRNQSFFDRFWWQPAGDGGES